MADLWTLVIENWGGAKVGPELTFYLALVAQVGLIISTFRALGPQPNGWEHALPTWTSDGNYPHITGPLQSLLWASLIFGLLSLRYHSPPAKWDSSHLHLGHSLPGPVYCRSEPGYALPHPKTSQFKQRGRQEKGRDKPQAEAEEGWAMAPGVKVKFRSKCDACRV